MEARSNGGSALESSGGPGQPYGPVRPRKKIILCFDGTGNKFSGTDADSNILKIYRMLDRSNGDKHYYQPGIGTYVNTSSLSHTSVSARLKSWYMKAKDSAVGTSFDDHVMGGYKFLMKTYTDHDIYIFGFSRGSYIARFLAEMLDHVGLLSAGNEEMAYFAWKAFAQWQERDEGSVEEIKKKREMFRFLQAFRETFSRPVRRIRFMGLFDTVNSVPRFENAWMQRSKFPYTARSSAKVIRHAVSIDERRAKFRSDLISEAESPKRHHHPHIQHHINADANGHLAVSGHASSKPQFDRYRRRSAVRLNGETPRPFTPSMGIREEEEEGRGGLKVQGNKRLSRSMSPAGSRNAASEIDASSVHSATSLNSFIPERPAEDDDDEDEEAAQNIEEIWFPGGHADLGGGWPLSNGEESPLSHGPLVWMVREARRAGLEFDSDRMLQLRCCDEDYGMGPLMLPSTQGPPIPQLQVTCSSDSPNLFLSPRSEIEKPGWASGIQAEESPQSSFLQTLRTAATKGVLHDCLEFNNGLTMGSVISWKLMEYLPFRRMDLRPDGSWKAISLPLPLGETRDIPANAWIHHSAIRRMEADENYRPGNLIIGGGGRGVRRPPKELGIGNWEVLKEEGDPVGEVYRRKAPSLDKQMG